MTKLWEDAGKSLTSRLFATGDTALVFWVWAATVWMIAQGGWSDFDKLVTPLFTDTSAARQLAVLIAGLLVVGVSSSVLSRFTLPTLRVLEGYWPRWPPWVVRLRDNRVEACRRRLQQLEKKTGLATEPEQVSALEVKLRHFPKSSDIMPTRIGNIIRAGERRPAYWYGLDPVVVWPQLWLTLPERTRTDLTQARDQLDRTVNTFNWALVSCGLGLLWPWALLVGFLVAWLVWRFWVPDAAAVYATLLSAIFDTHRFHLYDALHYRRPGTPNEEYRTGEAVTRILWNGGLPGDCPDDFTTELGDPPGRGRSVEWPAGLMGNE